MELITIIIALVLAFIAFKFLMGLLRIGIVIAILVIGAIVLFGGFA
ncbi:MAG: hypothetical protein WA985_01880 [Erythrobacter sp.]